MNGAESLVRTLAQAGVDVCFANPGTSEMHFVAALDRVPGVRCVLSLFEGGATGAADGYARMAEKPAATLLHLGTGLTNALPHVHNPRRANTPMVNIVGDHATYHRQYDAPLTSDIEGLARPSSHWVETPPDAMPLARGRAPPSARARRPRRRPRRPRGGPCGGAGPRASSCRPTRRGTTARGQSRCHRPRSS